MNPENIEFNRVKDSWNKAGHDFNNFNKKVSKKFKIDEDDCGDLLMDFYNEDKNYSWDDVVKKIKEIRDEEDEFL